MSNIISSPTQERLPKDVVKILQSCIDNVSQNIKCYCYDPVTNFTRNRVWTPDRIINYLIQMESKPMQSELDNYFTGYNNVPYDSSLCQQRAKLMPAAFERVLYLFTRSFRHEKTINGYYLLVADGSDLNIPYDPSDRETVCVSKGKEYSQYHINALYDCLNHIYWTINIDLPCKTRELDALKDMIAERTYPLKSIITADRGYESYDLMACCIESGQKFVFRAKDIGSNGTLKNCGLPDGEFDTDIDKILTRKQTKETKSNKQKYTLLANNMKFSYLDITEDYYKMSLRVVCIRLKDGNYEYLITNLDRGEFDIDDMKELYHYRWEIESSFRKLKHTVGLVNFRSRKRDFIRQEIFARFILYNLSSIIATGIRKKEKGKKHELASNFARSVCNVRLYLRKNIDETELIKRIKKYLIPIRPDRSYPRKVKPQSTKSFNNRAA